MQGRGPYDPEGVLGEVQQTAPQLYHLASTFDDITHPLYPPSCFPLIAPLVLLPWGISEAVVLVLSMVSYAFLLGLLSKRLKTLKRWYFCAFALAYGPLHAALQSANISAIAIPLGCLSMLLADSSPIGGAVLLGVAAALKPQLAILFFCHLLLSRRWKQLFLAGATGVIFLAIGTGWMYLHGVHWLEQYRQNLTIMVSPYANNSNAVTVRNAVNLELFNVQPLAYLAVHDIHKAILISYAAFAVLFGLYAAHMLFRYRPKPIHQDLLLLSLVSSLMLVAIYQRYYSAIGLIPAFAWALEMWPKPLAKVITCAGCIFIPPASKWSIVARLIESVGHRGNLSLSALKKSVLHTGMPEGTHLAPLVVFFLSLPMLFVVFLQVTSLYKLWFASRDGL